MEARFMQNFLRPKNPYRVFKVHINTFMCFVFSGTKTVCIRKQLKQIEI